jgi:hypothetical protein
MDVEYQKVKNKEEEESLGKGRQISMSEKKNML